MTDEEFMKKAIHDANVANAVVIAGLIFGLASLGGLAYYLVSHLGPCTP